MHCLDCKGCFALIFGSVLVILIKDDSLGDNESARLAYLEASRKEFYSVKQVAHKFSTIKKHNLYDDGTPSSFANSNGPHIKAANTRALLPWIHKLTSLHFNSGSRRDVS